MAGFFKMIISLFLLIAPIYAGSINDTSPFILSDGGYIQGTVYSEQGQVLSGASIIIYSADYDDVDSTITSSDGSFSLPLSSGSYYISAETPDYVKEFFPGEYEIINSQPITIFPSQVVDISFCLEIGGTINGEIVIGNDEPSDFMVSAVKVDYPHNVWQRDRTFRIINNGSYYIDGLLPGYYKVFVRGKGYRTVFYQQSETFDDAQIIEVNSGEIVGGVDFFLEQPGSGVISGRVLDVSFSNPICGTEVCAYQWSLLGDDPNKVTTTTETDGYYELEVTAGYYYISAFIEIDESHGDVFQVYHDNRYDHKLADLVQVDPSQVISEIDFEVDLTICHNLKSAGTLANQETGLPLEGVKVTAIDYHTGWAISSTYSNFNGDFIIENLISGVYILQLSGHSIIPGFWRDKFGWQEAEQIVLVSNDIELYGGGAITQDYGTPGLSITGQVERPDGALADVRLYAINLDNGIVAFAKSDQSGFYDISCGLQEGDYSLFADLYGYDGFYYPQVINLDLINNPHIEDINIYLSLASVNIPACIKPEKYRLIGNFPNPFNSGTLIKFFSERQSRSELVVFDVNGRLVKTISLVVEPGMNSVYWDGLSSDGWAVSSGVYFYIIKGLIEPNKMLLLK